MPLDFVKNEYLTKHEAAKLLGKSVPTLDRWNRLGTGPKRTRVGKTILYRKSALVEWLKRQEEAA